jgi:hypothetical protein
MSTKLPATHERFAASVTVEAGVHIFCPSPWNEFEIIEGQLLSDTVVSAGVPVHRNVIVLVEYADTKMKRDAKRLAEHLREIGYSRAIAVFNPDDGHDAYHSDSGAGE